MYSVLAFASLCLFFLCAGLLDLFLGLEEPDSSEISELLLELSELELGGDLWLLNFRVWRLFWEVKGVAVFIQDQLCRG